MKPVRCSVAFVLFGLAACSVSVGTRTTKPAGTAETTPTSTTKPTTKPTTTKPVDPEPTPAADAPTRVAADDGEPSPPRVRAVCRMEDAQLQALCHRVLDPIASADDAGWLGTLGEEVVLLRPGRDDGWDRIEGAHEMRRAMRAAGGVRELMHMEGERKLVGTLIKDCRQCTRAFVAVTANTRSGALAITIDPAAPPKVTRIELRREPVRRGEARPG